MSPVELYVLIASSQGTQILNLATETWTLGPELPNDIKGVDRSVAPYRETVLVFGLKKIYEFDIEQGGWVERTERLFHDALRLAIDITEYDI